MCLELNTNMLASGCAVVVVGAGHAGVQIAASLRAGGHAGRVVLLNGEAAPPYQRPPLSKAYLGLGETGPLAFRSDAFYADNAIELLPQRATAIDRERRHVVTEAGEPIPFDHLVLATGSTAHRLCIPGADRLVTTLECLRSADDLRRRLERARRIVVIGAGFIGLEVSATAASRGLDVEVVDLGARAMQRVVTPAVSAYAEGRQRAAGVRLRFGVDVAGVRVEPGGSLAVLLKGGAVLPADVVLAGVGARPNTDLAARAGLAVGDGVVVDSQLLTSDPGISAIGDCASFPTASPPGRIRLASVQNALDQARHVAARLKGATRPFEAIPCFWSDQGRDKLQIAGLVADHDRQVVRGDAAEGRFSILSYRAGTLVGVESINRPADHIAARRLLAAGISVPPPLAAAADFDLQTLLASEPVA